MTYCTTGRKYSEEANLADDQGTSVAVLAGGGIDSTTCMYRLQSNGFLPRALHVDFGQRSAALEWQAVERVAAKLGIKADQVCIRSGVEFLSAEIPGRNAALIFLALMHLLPQERLICIGIHAGTPFVDSTQSFLVSLERLVAEQTDTRIGLIAPLVDLTKSEVLTLARSIGVPLWLTHSCQVGVVGGCGGCHSCLDRKALGC